ncbi:hypothetical protein B0H14DRAFT_2595841 [Mycena olivaceomarginata]|nr:hypothetical protein B0H14DRAFT_2595841 [Mycena olivaceomarginata]
MSHVLGINMGDSVDKINLEIRSCAGHKISWLNYGAGVHGRDWDEQRRYSGTLQEPVEPVNGRCKPMNQSKELRLADEQMLASRRGAGGQKRPRGSESNNNKHLYIFSGRSGPQNSGSGNNTATCGWANVLKKRGLAAGTDSHRSITIFVHVYHIDDGPPAAAAVTEAGLIKPNSRSGRGALEPSSDCLTSRGGGCSGGETVRRRSRTGVVKRGGLHLAARAGEADVTAVAEGIQRELASGIERQEGLREG